MLDSLDWETYWRWETFRRACDPLDFRRWKRDSARALAGLYRSRPGALLLDSTAGLGDHTVNLAEEGFRVEACDRSALARESTARAAREAGIDVRVFDAEWESLGALAPARYDVIFNDALHWVYDEAELLRALVGMREALVPGGALVFFFADAREPDAGAGQRILAWDWAKMPRAELAWDHSLGDRSVTLTVVSERGEDFIDQHHLYVIREAGRARLESLTMRRVYRWDWFRLRALMEAAGFVGIESQHFDNVKGYRFAMNLARRPT